MLAVLGLLCLVTPLFDVISNYGLSEEAVVQWARDQPMDRFFLMRSLSISGILLLIAGVL